MSRASLLTGKWWPRALPAFSKTPLLLEQLHSAGYRTALIGKWHLEGHPMERGFDRFFGFLAGFAHHYKGAPSYQDDRDPFTTFGPGYYSTDAFTERAIEFIQIAGKEQPFFLYLSYQAPHNPLQAPAADVMRHRGKYLDGWAAVRAARFERQKKLGLSPAQSTLPDAPQNLPDWAALSPAQRDLEDLRMAVYAAMIERMDQAIGRLMKALESSGQAENTLVLFASDNGPDPFSVVNQVMLQRELLPGDRNSNWQLGTGWANACATPWRLYKISQHAGGVTSGAIAWWPGKIGQPGRIENSPIHMVDVLPTFLEAAQAAPGSDKIAGESFVSLLQGHPWQRKNPLFFQYMDNRAIRSAAWTLAEVDGAGWELFRTGDDPLEKTNLAAANPEVVAALNEGWLQWWCEESGHLAYVPRSTQNSQDYRAQGDRGSGQSYTPSAMPEKLSHRYPLSN